MKITYDTTEIKLTPRFKRALIELMEAECEMMRKNFPEDEDDWTAGECRITDLSYNSGLGFTYYGDRDRPKGRRFRIITGEDLWK
jgi:hypothetical protein